MARNAANCVKTKTHQFLKPLSLYLFLCLHFATISFWELRKFTLWLLMLNKSFSVRYKLQHFSLQNLVKLSNDFLEYLVDCLCVF